MILDKFAAPLTRNRQYFKRHKRVYLGKTIDVERSIDEEDEVEDIKTPEST